MTDTPDPAPPEDRVHIHVTTRTCSQPDCARTGFHFHWRGRAYLSVGQLDELDGDAFEADCQADNAARAAWRAEQRSRR